MASFRNSNLPDWAARENEGYFRRRSPSLNNQTGRRDSSRLDNIDGPPPLGGLEHALCLQKSPVTALSTLKHKRILGAFQNAYFWHLILLIVLFTLVSREIKGLEGMTFLKRVACHASAAVICTSGLLFLFTLYLTLQMFGILVTNPAKYGENIQDQITRCSTLRFLFKPMLLVLFISVDYYYVMELFDPDQLYIFRSKTSSIGCDWFKPSDCYIMEDRIIVQLATFTAAMDFFSKSYTHGRFELSFSSVPVKRHLGSLFNLSEVSESLLRSIVLSLCCLFFCAVFGPVVYYTLAYPFGLRVWEDGFFDRLAVLLRLGFLIRLFLYTAVTRTILPLLLKLVNYHLTLPVHFHIENSAAHEQCMLMSEAMASEINYLKYLAFYEYNCKGDNGHSDVSVVFKITHPGNHPHNWRNLYTAGVETVTAMNNGIVNFLKTSKMPPNFFQSGLGPYVLDQLRDRETESQRNGATSTGVEGSRMGNMRDLTASNGPDFPNQFPSITEVLRRNFDLYVADARAAVAELFSLHTLNTTLFYGRLTDKLEENIIANLLSDHLLSYWAIMGTNKLMCLSVDVDPRGVVNQDIMPFFVKVLETYDVMTALEIYIIKSRIEDHMACEKEIIDKDKAIVSKMINACAFVLSKLHATFSSCYPILGMDEDVVIRVVEIISSGRDRV